MTGETPPHIRARVHLARAVALAPALLVLEHPGADLEAKERAGIRRLHRGGDRRGHVATLVITQDDDFAKRAAPRALRLEPATGALTPIKKGWFR